MCLCMYKIYILYYLDSLAFSSKRVKKRRNSFFLFWKLFFNGKVMRIMGRCKEEIAGEKKNV